MNKNIKAMAISCGLILSTTLGMSNVVNAATIAVQEGEIRTLTIKTMEGKALEFVDDFDDEEEISYDGNDRNFKIILPKDSDGIVVKANVEDDDDGDYDYVSRIFLSKDDDAKPYETGDDIEIDDDYETIYIRTYKSEDDFDDAYYDDEVSDCEETYKIAIKREGTKEDKDESNSAAITSLPTLEYDNMPLIEEHKNEWVEKGLYWIRYNEDGDIVRDSWFLDNSNQKYYYLKPNGYMTVGWRYIEGDWYYFNESGEMQNGWVKSSEGKWYYLQSSGAMARDTTIDGYKLNIKGELIA